MQRSNNLIKSFGYAIEGVKSALQYNRNLRIHFIIGFLVILLGLLLRVSLFELGILSVLVLFVICTEMINSVLEEIVNLIVKEHREEAKIAKDVAAGMVLLATLGAVIIGLLVFIPHLF